MTRKTRLPEAKKVDFPVFAPSSDGVTELVMGKANLKAGTLVIEFNDKLPAIAVQRMIERGALIGLSFVLIQADDRNQAAQEELSEASEEEVPVDEESPNG